MIGDDLKLVSIQCVPVPNTPVTQCNVYMYGLDSEGYVWHKRDSDMNWTRESMKCVMVDAPF